MRPLIRQARNQEKQPDELPLPDMPTRPAPALKNPAPEPDRRLAFLIPLMLFVLALLTAVLSGWLLFNSSALGAISSIIINFGIDPQRALLIAALTIAAASALLGAMLGRRKLGAIVGAGLIFWFAYLSGFIEAELKPVYDPGGHLEPLNATALQHTAIMMMGLGLLTAFIGASVGIALGSVLLSPPYHLVQLIWKRVISRGASPWAQTVEGSDNHVLSVLKTASNWLGAVIMVGLLLIASQSGDLFLFSPDIGLHQVPKITNVKKGLPTHGTVVEDHLTSEALHGLVKPFLVYLPPSYNTPEGRTKHYPTLYLLHGSPGKDTDWVTGGKAVQSADTLIDTGKIPELIMILPDGNGRPGATTEWGNSFDQRQLIETYVTNDLVKYVDQHYRTIPQSNQRGIGGLSMGGFGAMNIAIHHPDVFGTVISLGGYYRAEGAIWGHNTAYILANSPIYELPQAPKAWKLHMYLGAATKDEPYYTDTILFMKLLDKLHISYKFDLQKGYHSWVVWQTQMYNALSWLNWKVTQQGEGHIRTPVVTHHR
ncbi:hypothetical protein EPA93_22410 [Ktedonosporobacter rubrisoli]|uniref:Esterase family protein n=1 Tax=Ktedonosporobacter rubrisoli TaxID=2509675 RepID=A0A4P6JUH4_KTERU|nr:alpha/beta hydrolase-fold protein [Ktedonosporobacter rubrisoli]QBD78596.1 hypothetical protein EPA93_22410 [Ktedonosporobacter rubrisoli]